MYPLDDTLPMPCPACMVLDCQDCVGVVEDADGLKIRCPCAEAGHEDWDDDEEWDEQDPY